MLRNVRKQFVALQVAATGVTSAKHACTYQVVLLSLK